MLQTVTILPAIGVHLNFQKNFSEKAQTDLYLSDIQPLLAPDIKSSWNPGDAISLKEAEIIPLLQGEPWKGTSND